MDRIYVRNKLGPMVAIGGAVLLGLFALNAMLVLTSAAYPNWLPRQFFGVDFLADNRRRAEGAALQYVDGMLGEDEPFVIVLGLSSASEGITLAALDEQLGDQARFLGLSGAGRNMRDVARYARFLLKTNARPAVAVFAINLFHLMDPPPPHEAFLQNLQRVTTIGEFLGGWLIVRRRDIKYAVDFGIDTVRGSAFEFFNVRPPADENPWREFVRLGLPQTVNDAQWQNNVKRYGERGYYDAANYARSRTQIDIFHEIIAEFIERGTDVVVVLMPEHSRLRARLPEVLTATLVAPLAERFGEQAPTIVDLRYSVPDSGFKDISHMNPAGRRHFGPLLGGAIAARLSPVSSQ